MSRLRITVEPALAAAAAAALGPPTSGCTFEVQLDRGAAVPLTTPLGVLHVGIDASGDTPALTVEVPRLLAPLVRMRCAPHGERRLVGTTELRWSLRPGQTVPVPGVGAIEIIPPTA